MLNLMQTEVFNDMPDTFKNNLNSALRMKLYQNIGIITPKHIELEILNLEAYAKKKSSSSLLLLDAIKLYTKSGGALQLFDLNLTDSPNESVDIPPFLPFIPGYARPSNNTGGQKATPAIFVNMYRLGKWSADGNSYDDLFPLTDLNASLESGYIAYKMIIEKKADDILATPTIMENLTRIYTKLFFDAITKTPGSLVLRDFQQEMGRFIIAKFFLIHDLQQTNNDLINSYAYKISNSNSSIQALIEYESNLQITYDSLSGFLSSFGSAFFLGVPTNLPDFEKAWIAMYGEGMPFAIEYIPYLLHFLFAAVHNSRLGGSSKLIRRYPDLQKEGLAKLYSGVIVAVNK